MSEETPTKQAPKPAKKPAAGKKRRKKPGGASRAQANAAPPNRFAFWWGAGIVAVLLAGLTRFAWDPRPEPEPHVQRGNGLYAGHRYRDALGEYETAPGAGARNAGTQLDRGIARYRVTVPPPDGGGLPMLPADAGTPPEGLTRAQDEMRTAARGGTTNSAEDVDAFLRARAAYDLGNTFFSQHGWDSAIDAYKEALRLSPGWRDAAWNLELARRLREAERNPPDAGQDASSQQDASQPDSGNPDGGHNDGGGQDASGDGGGRGDSGAQGDSGQNNGADSGSGQPDAGNDGGGNGNDAGGNAGQDAGSPPADAGPPPRSMAPLDDLNRSEHSLQQELLRRHGATPRNPDEDR